MQEECFLWAGASVTKAGYGMVGINSNHGTTTIHRLVYESLVGKIPEGLEIDHLCKNKICINPEHLEAVTHKVNMQRRYGVNLCKRGHTLTNDNVLISIKDSKTKRIGRQCKTCVYNRRNKS